MRSTSTPCQVAGIQQGCGGVILLIIPPCIMDIVVIMSAGWEHAPTTSRANAAGETSRLLDQIFAVRIKIKTVQNKSGFFSEKRSKNEKSLQSRPLVARHGEADRSVYGQERQTGLFMAKRGRQVCLWPREADRSVYGQERQTGLFMAKRGRQVCLWPREADRSVYGQERQTGLFMAKRGRQVCLWPREADRSVYGQERQTGLFMAKRGRQVCLWPREADRSVYG